LNSFRDLQQKAETSLRRLARHTFTNSHSTFNNLPSIQFLIQSHQDKPQESGAQDSYEGGHAVDAHGNH